MLRVLRGVSSNLRAQSDLRTQQRIAAIEGRTNPNSPNPADHPLSKRGPLAALALGVALGMGPLMVPNLEGFAPPDRQERLINAGARKALGNTSLRVTCVPDSQMILVGSPGPKEGFGAPFTGISWMKESDCAAIEAFIQQPPTAADLSRQSLTKTVEEEIWGLQVAAHEISHSVLNTSNESKAGCFALQLTPDLAERYGMDPALKPALQKQLLGIMLEYQSAPGVEEYRFGRDCRLGGNQDLSSQHLGTQVYFPY